MRGKNRVVLNGNTIRQIFSIDSCRPSAAFRLIFLRIYLFFFFFLFLSYLITLIIIHIIIVDLFLRYFLMVSSRMICFQRVSIHDYTIRSSDTNLLEIIFDFPLNGNSSIAAL